MEKQPRPMRDLERLSDLMQILAKVSHYKVAEGLRDSADPNRVSGIPVLNAFRAGIEFALYGITPVTITMPSGETLTFEPTQEVVSTEEDSEERDYYDKLLTPKVMDHLRRNLITDDSPDIEDIFEGSPRRTLHRARQLRALRETIREG